MGTDTSASEAPGADSDKYGLERLTVHVSPSPGRHRSAAARLQSPRYELSAHGAKSFVPPEVNAAWARGSPNLRLSARDASRWDVYALGLVLRYMLLGVAPAGLVVTVRTDRAGSGTFLGMRLPWQKKRAPPAPPLKRDMGELPPAVAALIEDMTAEEVAKRIGLSELIENPWVAAACERL